jgi:hypothetical protein
MRGLVALLLAATSAAAVKLGDVSFLQMGLRTKRLRGDDDDDMTYGAYGQDDAAMDESDHLGVHEFIEANDDQIDEEDRDDPDIARAAADDEATNFGEDGDAMQEAESYNEQDQEEAVDAF